MPQIYKFFVHLGVDLTALPVAPISYFKWVPPNIVINEFGQIFEIKNIAGVLSAYYQGGYLVSEEIYDEFPKMDSEIPLGMKLYKELLDKLNLEEKLKIKEAESRYSKKK